jgi:hypothetical protein
MKKMMILAVMMVMTISANAMNYNAAKHEALFLSDKIAYELNLTAAQYEAVYEINLDYLMSLNGHGDVFGIWWDRRNADLRFVLNTWQFDKYMSLVYFYRPVAWKAGNWTFAVYSHYDRGHFYHAHPKVFVTYKGGNSHRNPRFYADRHIQSPTYITARRWRITMTSPLFVTIASPIVRLHKILTELAALPATSAHADRLFHILNICLE